MGRLSRKHHLTKVATQEWAAMGGFLRNKLGVKIAFLIRPKKCKSRRLIVYGVKRCNIRGELGGIFDYTPTAASWPEKDLRSRE